jgi:hypothetical protein
MDHVGMETTKECFKKRYVNILFIWLFIAIGSLIITFVVDLWFISVPSALVVAISIPGLLAVRFMLWLDLRNQGQGFIKKQLVIFIPRQWDYPLYSRYNMKRLWKYEVIRAKKVTKNFFYIFVHGEIRRTIYDGEYTVSSIYEIKTVRKVRIPRTFTNEDQIINLDIDAYNEQQAINEEKAERERIRFIKKTDPEYYEQTKKGKAEGLEWKAANLPRKTNRSHLYNNKLKTNNTVTNIQVLVFVLIIATLSIIRPGSPSSLPTKSDVIQIADDYLTERYGDIGYDFTIIRSFESYLGTGSGSGRSLNAGNRTGRHILSATCEGRDFLVTFVRLEQPGFHTVPVDYIYSDTFLSVLVREKYYSALDECMLKHVDEYKRAFTAISKVPDYQLWKENASIDEYLAALDLKELFGYRIGVVVDRGSMTDEECLALSDGIIGDWIDMTSDRQFFTIAFFPSDRYEEAIETDVLSAAIGYDGFEDILVVKSGYL